MKCWCCGVEIPKDAKVELCPDCMNASIAPSMQIYCKIHKKRLKPTEFSH